jgi:exodeoxyribonuclease VII large subunit
MARPPRRVTSLFTPAQRRREERAKTPREQAPTDPKKVGVDPDAQSVSQVVGRIKRALENQVGQVVVVGEISSFRAWRSGHWYFDLKDDRATLPAVMFRGDNRNVRFEPEDGVQVVARGRISLYEAQSKAQLVVESLQPVGQGALALAFEELKSRLSKEGLFDAERKKSLPIFPRTVGVVTSPQGAALQDMVRVLRQRMPGINVLLAPTRVQGTGSADEIAAALSRLDGSQRCDVIIVGRGGGSLEDLWAFNEEKTARAIAACETPVIAAVGHETDVTIADWVADHRAATPTHGAADAVPDLDEWVARLNALFVRLTQKAESELRLARLEIEKRARALGEPRLLLARSWQNLDQLNARLDDATRARLKNERRRFESARGRLAQQAPHHQMTQRRVALGDLAERLARCLPMDGVHTAQARLSALAQRHDNAGRERVRREAEKLGHLAAALGALSPLSVLGRGYGLVSREEEGGTRVLTRADQVHAGDPLEIRFEDGRVQAQATHVDLGDKNHQNPKKSGEDP